MFIGLIEKLIWIYRCWIFVRKIEPKMRELVSKKFDLKLREWLKIEI